MPKILDLVRRAVVTDTGPASEMFRGGPPTGPPQMMHERVAGRGCLSGDIHAVVPLPDRVVRIPT